MKTHLLSALLVLVALTDIKANQTTYINVFSNDSIKVAVDTSVVSSVIYPSESWLEAGFVGEGFEGDTINATLKIANTDTIPLYLHGLPFISDTVHFHLGQALADSTLLDSMSMLDLNIWFTPKGDTLLSHYSFVQWATADTSHSFTNEDTTEAGMDTTYIFKNGFSTVISGFTFALDTINMNDDPEFCQQDSALAVVTDSCGYTMHNLENDYIEQMEAEGAGFTNISVTQSVAPGEFILVNTPVTVNILMDHPIGYHYYGTCTIEHAVIDSIDGAYACPPDSLSPVPTTEGNGGNATISGILNNGGAQKVNALSPIPGALVYLLYPGTGEVVGVDTTDAQGLFSFSGLAAGGYQLAVQFEGLPMDQFANVIEVGTESDEINIAATSDGAKISVEVLTGLVTSLDEQTTGPISFYPNPSTGQINLVGNEGQVQFNIVDLQGKLVSAGSASRVIDLTGINAGFYTLNVVSGSEMIAHKLMIAK